MNAMTTKTNWSSLLTGTINGVDYDYTETDDGNIYANGSPTLELYVKSWNEKYPNNKLYTATKEGMEDAIGYGYYVGTSENPTTISANMSSTPGYSDTLYYPHTSLWNSCYGYWLDSPSANLTSSWMYVGSGADMGNANYASKNLAFRPIICLPSNILE